MKNLDDEIDNLKNKIKNIKLDDDFKEDLSNKIETEYRKDNISKKKKTFYFPKQIVAAVFCVIILTSCAFADEIGNFVNNLFSNTTLDVEQLLANGNLQAINMDYIEQDGVAIKVDYVLQEENSLYIVFNILADEEINKVYLEKIKVINQDNNVIFDNINYIADMSKLFYRTESIDNKNIMLTIKLDNLEKNENKEINIYIEKIKLKYNNSLRNIEKQWKFNIEI